MLKKISQLIMVSLIAVVLVACSHNDRHEPLHGLYYGRYTSLGIDEFIILAFSKDHKDSMAMRSTVNGIERNFVFKVYYGKNTVTVREFNKPMMVLQISKDTHTLTMTDVNHQPVPIKYTFGSHNDKLFSPKIGDIAYKANAKKSKKHANEARAN